MQSEIAANALDRPRSRSLRALGIPQAAGAGCVLFLRAFCESFVVWSVIIQFGNAIIKGIT